MLKKTIMYVTKIVINNECVHSLIFNSYLILSRFNVLLLFMFTVNTCNGYYWLSLGNGLYGHKK